VPFWAGKLTLAPREWAFEPHKCAPLSSPSTSGAHRVLRRAIVPGKRIGAHSYSGTVLQETLDAHAREGWQLRFIIPERERPLVTFERPAGHLSQLG